MLLIISLAVIILVVLPSMLNLFKLRMPIPILLIHTLDPDEITLVRPGFNSWCGKIIGPSYLLGRPAANELLNHFAGSNYSYRVLYWRDPVGLTDIQFFTSSKLGDEYTNNIFVGDINNGNLYFLEVNQSRDRINFDSQQESGLSDLRVDNKTIKGTAYKIEEELSEVDLEA